MALEIAISCFSNETRNTHQSDNNIDMILPVSKSDGIKIRKLLLAIGRNCPRDTMSPLLDSDDAGILSKWSPLGASTISPSMRHEKPP